MGSEVLIFLSLLSAKCRYMYTCTILERKDVSWWENKVKPPNLISNGSCKLTRLGAWLTSSKSRVQFLTTNNTSNP